MKVPFINLNSRYDQYKESFHKVLDEIIDNSQFILGQSLNKFENNLSEYIGTKYSVGVGNGTDALILGLKSLGIGQGDEVITTPMSYLASTSAIYLAGAEAKFVDIGDDLNLDPIKVENAINHKTKAILVVHLAGVPAKMVQLKTIADKNGLKLIEDCAQSIGAQIDDRFVGSFGDISAISFHPTKNLGALGDGGIVLTNHQESYDWLKKARNHGHSSRDQCEFWSMNSRLDNMQAAFLDIMLKDLPKSLNQRRSQADRYKKLLDNMVTFPEISQNLKPTFNFFMILADRRDDLMDWLQKQGIDSKIHYPIPIHQMDACSLYINSKNDLSKAIENTSKILSLPIGPHIDDSQIDYVCKKIKDFYI